MRRRVELPQMMRRSLLLLLVSPSCASARSAADINLGYLGPTTRYCALIAKRMVGGSPRGTSLLPPLPAVFSCNSVGVWGSGNESNAEHNRLVQSLGPHWLPGCKLLHESLLPAQQ